MPSPVRTWWRGPRILLHPGDGPLIPAPSAPPPPQGGQQLPLPDTAPPAGAGEGDPPRPIYTEEQMTEILARVDQRYAARIADLEARVAPPEGDGPSGDGDPQADQPVGRPSVEDLRQQAALETERRERARLEQELAAMRQQSHDAAVERRIAEALERTDAVQHPQARRDLAQLLRREEGTEAGFDVEVRDGHPVLLPRNPRLSFDQWVASQVEVRAYLRAPLPEGPPGGAGGGPGAAPRQPGPDDRPKPPEHLSHTERLRWAEKQDAARAAGQRR